MKTKQSKINFLEGILQLISLIVLWFGKIADYSIAGGKSFNTNLGVYEVYDEVNSSIYFKDFFEVNGVFATIIIALCLCNIIMCLFSAFSKNNAKDGVIHSIVPIIIFALSIFVYGNGVFSITTSIRESVCFHTPVKSIVLIILFIVIILSIIKRSKFIVADDNKTKSISTNTSSTDELKKYKELLDSDVITQEEFDQKKKQLLGL